jgi:methylenetetrahydrofolate reductase (NADPH)
MSAGGGRLAELLAAPRYEVIPLSGVEEAVLEVVPRSLTVTVTASPTRGLEPTLELATRLLGAGYAAVPHLSARLVGSEQHLAELLARLGEAGAEEVFVVAGDAEAPAGPFAGAADLLRAMSRLGHPFARIGITGYPESHPLIDDETTIQAMFEKAAYADSITSQICFDAAVTCAWIEDVWARGTRLPIHVGIPGVVSTTKLVRVSAKIGLGDSMRFLRRHLATVGRLVRPGAFRPDDLIAGLAPCLADPEGKVAGFHVFTFNELEATERWRRERLAALAEPVSEATG